MMQMYNQQGITENYPQYTTNFWGNAGNNYGFGTSNIKQNIENVTNRLNNSFINTGVQNNAQQLQMPAGTQQQITMPNNNLQKYNNNFANFVSNTYDIVNNTYNDIKQDYFGQRNYQNRYKQGCTPSNIAYNTISNYQISPNPKLVENGNIVSNYGMKKFLSKIPIAGKYINGIATGEKIGNGLTNFYNALDEADCFK